MDPAQALADLAEVSSQIEGAVLLGDDGAVLASTFGDADTAGRVGEAAAELLRTAQASRAATGRAELSHLLATTGTGSVFLVLDGGRAVAAVAGPDPVAGLVFYDLKTCLRLADAGAPDASSSTPARKPAASRRRSGAKSQGSDDA